MLARFGFIEEDPDRGSRRERWWRASHERTPAEVEDLKHQVLALLDSFRSHRPDETDAPSDDGEDRRVVGFQYQLFLHEPEP